MSKGHGCEGAILGTSEGNVFGADSGFLVYRLRIKTRAVQEYLEGFF